MAKRRLTSWMRSKLETHIAESIEPKAEKKVLDAAYKKAARLVAELIEKKYPAKDMAVLDKYGQAARDDDVKIQCADGTVVEFVFDEGAGPLIPEGRRYSAMYLADATRSAAVDAWADARKTFAAEVKKRQSAYTALIQGANYVEDLLDVWPEAATIIPPNTLPIPLGPEQIAVVKADLRERKAA